LYIRDHWHYSKNINRPERKCFKEIASTTTARAIVLQPGPTAGYSFLWGWQQGVQINHRKKGVPDKQHHISSFNKIRQFEPDNMHKIGML